MKYILYLTFLLNIYGCGTYDIDSLSKPISTKTIKTGILYGSLCGLVSAYVAKEYSPTKKDQGFNIATFGTAGATLCGATSAYLNHKEENEVKDFEYEINLQPAKKDIVNSL